MLRRFIVASELRSSLATLVLCVLFSGLFFVLR